MPLIRALIGIVIVETYAASWIEIYENVHRYAGTLSRLTQPRGLKWFFPGDSIPLSMSRLTQPRGLKFRICLFRDINNLSRLTQPRGLKLF